MGHVNQDGIHDGSLLMEKNLCISIYYIEMLHYLNYNK